MDRILMITFILCASLLMLTMTGWIIYCIVDEVNERKASVKFLEQMLKDLEDKWNK